MMFLHEENSVLRRAQLKFPHVCNEYMNTSSEKVVQINVFENTLNVFIKDKLTGKRNNALKKLTIVFSSFLIKKFLSGFGHLQKWFDGD